MKNPVGARSKIVMKTRDVKGKPNPMSINNLKTTILNNMVIKRPKKDALIEIFPANLLPIPEKNRIENKTVVKEYDELSKNKINF